MEYIIRLGWLLILIPGKVRNETFLHFIKALLNKIVSFPLILLLFLNCFCSPPHEEGPAEVTLKFVNSFVKADTALFYSTVEIDSVVDHMNKIVWQHDDNKYKVREILFFRYAPLKISMSGLQEIKEHPFPFSHFEFDSVERTGSSIRSIVSWRGIYDDSLKILILTVYEKAPGVWKIKAIDFPTVPVSVR